MAAVCLPACLPARATPQQQQQTREQAGASQLVLPESVVASDQRLFTQAELEQLMLQELQEHHADHQIPSTPLGSLPRAPHNMDRAVKHPRAPPTQSFSLSAAPPVIVPVIMLVETDAAWGFCSWLCLPAGNSINGTVSTLVQADWLFLLSDVDGTAPQPCSRGPASKQQGRSEDSGTPAGGWNGGGRGGQT
ncbi:hypothetical protein ABBQ38_001419 [Trebouxia sp. C0009 RCD-2024]